MEGVQHLCICGQQKQDLRHDSADSSEQPSEQPTEDPTEEPTEQPTEEPSEQPAAMDWRYGTEDVRDLGQQPGRTATAPAISK